MQVKTSELPGIGRKYTLDLSRGGQIVIIIHHHGLREVYYFKEPDDDEPSFFSQFSDEEARQIGTLLLGVDYQPVAEDKMELLLKSVRLDWIKVEHDSCLANKTILESKIRTMTGSTVIGIQRGEKVIGSPDIHEKILPGDTLMAIGTRDQTKSLETMCRL